MNGRLIIEIWWKNYKLENLFGVFNFFVDYKLWKINILLKCDDCEINKFLICELFYYLL